MIIKQYYFQKIEEVKNWGEAHLLGLFLFNLIIMILVLLRSAGYFAPFFPITINFTVLFALILTVVLLGFKSKELFLVALLLWVFTGALRVVNVQVWAERSAVYVFEALIVGMIVFIIENTKSKK